MKLNYTEIAQQHIADNYPYIVYAKPQLSDLPPGAIIGSWGISVPQKVKFILDKSMEMAPGVLPGDVARAWVRDQYDTPFHRRRDQLDPSFRSPMHAVRGEYGDCCYVDIKAAYLRVLTLGYDLEYLPGHYLGAKPTPVPGEVAAEKFCYAIAVSMSATTQNRLQIKGKEGIFNRNAYNVYANPCLYNVAQDTLNGIGAEMLSVLGDHVHYMNTDGYIVDRGYEQFAMEIVASWGFKSRVKHDGETSVYGVGAYKIGDFLTTRRDDHAQNFTSKLMNREERAWLKRRWRLWNAEVDTLVTP